MNFEEFLNRFKQRHPDWFDRNMGEMVVEPVKAQEKAVSTPMDGVPDRKAAAAGDKEEWAEVWDATDGEAEFIE